MSSCPASATAPIDIARNVDGYCDLKCDYGFQYPFSPVTITHGGDHLRFTYDLSNQPPVLYNTNNYEVIEARLYTPSLHTYAGESADAELLIIHTNTSGRGTLIVAIPVVQDTTGKAGKSDSITLFDTLLVEAGRSANSTGLQTVVNNATCTLNKFIPLKPYYSYTGSLPYLPCDGTDVDYVVFSVNQAAQTAMSFDAFTMLTKLLKPHAYQVSKGNKGGLFYNRVGPRLTTAAAKDDGLYIECQPTGEDGEVFIPNQQTSAQLFNGGLFVKILQNGLFQTVIGVLLMIIIMKIGRLILDKLTAEDNPGKALIQKAVGPPS